MTHACSRLTRSHLEGEDNNSHDPRLLHNVNIPDVVSVDGPLVAEFTYCSVCCRKTELNHHRVQRNKAPPPLSPEEPGSSPSVPSRTFKSSDAASTFISFLAGFMTESVQGGGGGGEHRSVTRCVAPCWSETRGLDLCWVFRDELLRTGCEGEVEPGQTCLQMETSTLHTTS